MTQDLNVTDQDDVGEARPTYTVTIEGPGIKIEKSIGNDQLLAIMSVALGTGPMPIQGVAQSAPQGARGGVPPASGRPAVSSREFLIQTGAKTIPQKMAALVAYSRDHLGREQVSRDDFKSMFQRASEVVPKNISRDLRLAMDQGWLAEDHADSNQIYLTGTGDDTVRQGFSGDTGSGRSTPTRRRTRRSNTKAKAGPTESSETEGT